MNQVKLLSLIVLSVIVLGIIPIMAPIYADTTVYRAPDDNDIIVGNGEMNLTIPTIDFDKALNLAYTIRNLTYNLFQWEIEHNVTVANVTLNKGDKFLDRAIELKDNNTRKAIVFAIVATIQYSHATAYTHSVLAKVVYDNMGANNTITEDTVRAVLSISSELRSILENAVEYASNNNYNTTAVINIISKGDNLTQTAEQYLNEGNITLAFRTAVAGYRRYTEAYSELVRTVIIQYLRSIDLIKPKRIWIPVGLLDKLPQDIKGEILAKINSGELKSMKNVIDAVKSSIQRRIEERREAEYRQIANIMASTLVRFSNHPALKGTMLRDYCYQIVKEVAQRTNATGIQLLQLSLQELQNRLGSQGLNIQGEIRNNIITIRTGHK